MGHFFGFVDIVPGTTQTIDVGASGIAGVLIGNESGYTVVVAMSGNNFSKSLYPGTVDFFPVSWGFTGLITFASSQLLSNITSWPGAYLQIDVIGANENISSQYPFALARIYNIGNTVSTNMGNATAIVNDGNTASTQIVEATVGADLTSSVTLTNDGILTLGNSTRSGGVTTEGGNIFVNGAGSIGGAGLLYSTLGSGFGLSVTSKASIEGGNIASDGAGSLSVAGHYNMGETVAVQTIASAGTITVGAQGMIDITITANRSGVILQAGATSGQIIGIVNRSAFVLTFAAVGTSNVQDGTNKTIQPFSLKLFMWNGNNSSWYTL